MVHLQAQIQDRPIMVEHLVLKTPEHTQDLLQRADQDLTVVLITQDLRIAPDLMEIQGQIAQEAMVIAEALAQGLTGALLVIQEEADLAVSQPVAAIEVLVAECHLEAQGQEAEVVYLQEVLAQEAVVQDHLQEAQDHLADQEEVINSSKYY